AQALADSDAPVVAASDYVRAYADQIRPFVPTTYRVLGTDGFGRSESPRQLRHFFEVDRRFVTIAGVDSLSPRHRVRGKGGRSTMDKLGIDPEKRNPRLA